MFPRVDKSVPNNSSTMYEVIFSTRLFFLMNEYYCLLRVVAIANAGTVAVDKPAFGYIKRHVQMEGNAYFDSKKMFTEE